MSSCVSSSYESFRGMISRFFWNVRHEHIDQNNIFACDNIPGSNKLHSIHVYLFSTQ
jgi:hypothetical protein